MNRRVALEVGVWLAAFGLSVAATWPLAAELPSDQRLADRTLDDYIPYWNCWWIRQALVVEQTNPFFCDRIFHPEGANLAVSPLALPLTLASLPLQAAHGSLVGAMQTVKWFIFLSFPIAVVGAWRLLRGFQIPASAAFLGGCVFAFVPFRLLHQGRVHYLAGALVPWFLWLCLVAWQRERAWKRVLVAAGAVFAFAGAMDAALLPDLTCLGGACAVAASIARRSWRPLGRTAAAGVLGMLFLAPILVPFLKDVRENPGTDVVQLLRFETQPRRSQLILSPDANNLAYYLSPTLHEALSPHIGTTEEGARSLRQIHQSFRPPTERAVVDVNGAPLALLETFAAALAALGLAGFGLRGMRDRRTWPFVIVGLVGLALSLGPYRAFGDEVVRMPFYWISQVVPGMSAGRYTAAHLRLFHLGLAVTAAFGLARAHPSWRAAGGTVLLLVAGSWLLRPSTFEPMEREPAYELMRDDPTPGHVLGLPPREEPARRRMALGQIVHERAIMNGPLTRVPDAAWAFHTDEPVVPRWLRPPPFAGRGEAWQREVEENVEALRRYGIRYALIRRVIWSRQPELREQLLGYLQAHPGLDVQLTSNGHLLVLVHGGE